MDGVDGFRRLARSSPWRWSSVRFTFDDGEWEPVRGWVRRPDSLRVELLDGRLVEARPGDRIPSGFSMLYVGDGSGAPGPDELPTPAEPMWWTHPTAPRPDLDAEGLLTQPVDLPMHVVVDDPMWQNYRWVAMLNPRELADGDEGAPGVAVDSLSGGIRHGRPTLYATVRPVDGYAPRCSCCPLLPSRQAVIAEGYGDPDGPFADEHRVALDLSTGICVSARERGGPRDGRGFDVVIEAVDEPMGDELFHLTRQQRLRRHFGVDRPQRTGWSPVPGLAPEPPPDGGA